MNSEERDRTRQIKDDIEAGRTNYPDATVTIMQKVMDER